VIKHQGGRPVGAKTQRERMWEGLMGEKRSPLGMWGKYANWGGKETALSEGPE